MAISWRLSFRTEISQLTPNLKITQQNSPKFNKIFSLFKITDPKSMDWSNLLKMNRFGTISAKFDKFEFLMWWLIYLVIWLISPGSWVSFDLPQSKNRFYRSVVYLIVYLIVMIFVILILFLDFQDKCFMSSWSQSYLLDIPPILFLKTKLNILLIYTFVIDALWFYMIFNFLIILKSNSILRWKISN